MAYSELLAALAESIAKGKEGDARELVEGALGKGIPPDVVMMEGVARGAATVSEWYETYEVGLIEVYEAAEAIKAVFRILEPELKRGRIGPIGRAVIGVIEGDIHDIGKNIVATLLRGAGFEVIDLGRDVLVERFVDEAVDRKADIIAISTMMTTTMPNMRRVVEVLDRRGLRNKIKVLLGGRPITQRFADAIGADGYGKNGYEAVKKAKQLMRER